MRAVSDIFCGIQIECSGSCDPYVVASLRGFSFLGGGRLPETEATG